jgi:hypothetical protein
VGWVGGGYLVVGALAQLRELFVRVVVERAVGGSEHDGHLADEHLGEVLLLHVRLVAIFRGGGDRLRQIHVKRRRVSALESPGDILASPSDSHVT